MMKKWILKRMPQGNDKGYSKPVMEDFELVTEPIPSEADMQEGDVVVQNFFVSVDPYVPAYCMGENYLGKAIVASVAGKVIASRSPDFVPGDFAMSSNGGAADFTIQSADKFKKISNDSLKVPFDPESISISASLGILGMPGVTSYFGLKDNIGADLQGQTIVVTGAAGAVGSAVGQLAKIWGAAKGKITMNFHIVFIICMTLSSFHTDE